MNLNAKPCHLCSFGNVFAGEINQCQRPGYKWLEVKPKFYVVFCEQHYDYAQSIIEGRSDGKTSSTSEH